jgi:hypothetical protein
MSLAVMNNSDLRRVIWSYLRKKPKIKCYKCNRVCVWDKKTINTYYEYYITNFIEFDEYICWNCYWTNLCTIS